MCSCSTCQQSVTVGSCVPALPSDPDRRCIAHRRRSVMREILPWDRSSTDPGMGRVNEGYVTGRIFHAIIVSESLAASVPMPTMGTSECITSPRGYPTDRAPRDSSPI